MRDSAGTELRDSKQGVSHRQAEFRGLFVSPAQQVRTLPNQSLSVAGCARSGLAKALREAVKTAGCRTEQPQMMTLAGQSQQSLAASAERGRVGARHARLVPLAAGNYLIGFLDNPQWNARCTSEHFCDRIRAGVLVLQVGLI